MAIEEIANMIAEQETVQSTTGNPALDELAQSARAQIEESQKEAQQMEPEVQAVQETTEVLEPEKVEVNTEEVKQETAEKEWWDSEQTEEKSLVENTETQNAVEEKKEETPFDDDIKLLMEYKKSGKTLKDFINDYKVEDFSGWNDKDFVEKGMSKYLDLSSEEFEQAMFEYDQAGILQKKQIAEQFKTRFEQENEMKLKELTTFDSKREENNKALADKYSKELNEYSEKIANKEMFGLKVTDEMSKNLKNFIDKEFSFQRQDGSFDVEKIYSVALWMKYGKDLVKANVTKARNEGKEQIIKEVSNPSKNMSSSSRSAGSGLEAVQEAFNSLFNR